jgi:hypothetical protein
VQGTTEPVVLQYQHAGPFKGLRVFFDDDRVSDPVGYVVQQDIIGGEFAKAVDRGDNITPLDQHANPRQDIAHHSRTYFLIPPLQGEG